MQVEIKSGHYVVAVSGGVDSMALLHRLQAEPGVQLTVAHLDHGIRADSAEDLALVQETAGKYGLPFVAKSLKLGKGTSEARARTARYAFLRQVRQSSGAAAIVTAHHQDDLLETAIINILRGTGPKGLTALRNRPGLTRPLLRVPKHEILAYAKAQDVHWREDNTNADLNYLRNYVRHQILPRFDEAARAKFLRLITDLQVTNAQIDGLLVNYLHLQSVSGQLDRYAFNQLPHAEARETMAGWLRSHQVRDFDRKALERLVVMAKVAKPGSRYDVSQGVNLHASKSHLALYGTER